MFYYVCILENNSWQESDKNMIIFFMIFKVKFSIALLEYYQSTHCFKPVDYSVPFSDILRHFPSDTLFFNTLLVIVQTTVFSNVNNGIKLNFLLLFLVENKII